MHGAKVKKKTVTNYNVHINPGLLPSGTVTVSK
jgi:hypothetical protein